MIIMTPGIQRALNPVYSMDSSCKGQLFEHFEVNCKVFCMIITSSGKYGFFS